MTSYKIEHGYWCISCKKKPVLNKKYQLCKGCYKELKTELSKVKKTWEEPSPRNYKKLEDKPVSRLSKSEKEFIESFFNHENWVFHPATFNVGEKRYTPDFYDGETNTFIEVSGSRQAFSNNKETYELMKKRFPNIKLEIRKPNGELFITYGNKRGRPAKLK